MDDIQQKGQVEGAVYEMATGSLSSLLPVTDMIRVSVALHHSIRKDLSRRNLVQTICALR